jgi:hypothetical protein
MTPDGEIIAFERQRERERKRRVLATIVAAKGRAAVPLELIEEVLRAVREAGYLVIDKDRVVDVHTSYRIREEERDLVPKLMDHVRKTAAFQIGRHLARQGRHRVRGTGRWARTAVDRLRDMAQAARRDCP